MTVSARTKLTPSPVGAVVLGVSRSGTSLASGSLVAAGFCVGRDQDLMPASSANPAGHWENMTVYRANEELLAAAGGSWFSPPSRDAQLSIQARASDRLRDLLCLLREHADHRPLVIKDPRVAALLDLWGPLIDGLLHPVLVVRDPVEIALSLEARDGTPTAFALASWEVQTSGLLGFLHGRAVTIVRYEDLLASSEAVTAFVAAATARLDQRFRACIDPAAAARMVRPQLRRNDARSLDAGEYLTGRQAELWHFLEGLSTGDQELSVHPELRRPKHAAVALTAREPMRLRAEELGTNLAAELRALRARAAELDTLAKGWQDRAARAEQVATRAEQRHLAVTNSKSWRITAPLRAVGNAARRARPARSRSLPASQAGP